jgi:hypothetical protein
MLRASQRHVEELSGATLTCVRADRIKLKRLEFA